MKIKTFITCLLAALSITISSTPALAQDNNTSITYFDDGSYLVTTLIPEDEPVISPYALTYNVNKTGITKYYNDDGKLMWYLKVMGNFTYNGTTAKCNSADVEAKSYNSCWKLLHLSSSRSGATAYASCVSEFYMGSTRIRSFSNTISLTCHPDGTFTVQ